MSETEKKEERGYRPFSSYEDQGTGHDPHASGYEKQGRAAEPFIHVTPKDIEAYKKQCKQVLEANPAMLADFPPDRRAAVEDALGMLSEDNKPKDD